MATGGVRFVIEADTSGAITGIRTFQSALAQTGTSATQAGNQATTAFDRLEKVLGKARSAVIGMVSAFVVVQAVRAFRELVNAGIEFESTFAGIRKTVDGSVVEFERLEGQMRQLAKTIPINVNELNKIGEIAGSLGVPTEKIAEFTETIAKIGLATNLSTEEAATGFARFAAIMDIPIDRIKTFASTVVRLGNEFPATEQEILAFSLNIAGAGKQVGLTEDQIAALSTALASTGLHAEKAGSAMSRILKEMAIAIANGGAQLQAFADVAKVSTTEFASAFEKDAAVALIKFLEELKKLDGAEAIKALEDLSLGEIRVSDVTLRSAEAVGFFRRALISASDEMGKTGQALDREVAKRMDTIAANADKLVARLRDLAIAVSLEVAPALLDMASGFVDSIESAADFARENEILIYSIIGIGTAIGGLSFLKWVIGFEAVKHAIVVLSFAFTSVTGAAAALEVALNAIPILALVGLIAYLGKGLADTVQAHFDAVEAAEAAAKAETEYGRTVAARALELEKAGVKVKELSVRGIKAAQDELDTRLWFESRQQEIRDRETAAREKATEEFIKDVQRIKDSVLDLANNAPQLETALTQMGKAGIPATLIIDKLGKTISETAAQMKTLGREVPDSIERLAELRGLLSIGEIEAPEFQDFRTPWQTPDWMLNMPGPEYQSPVYTNVGPQMEEQIHMIDQALEGIGVLRTADGRTLDLKLAIDEAAKKRALETFKDLKDQAGKIFDGLLEKGFGGIGDVLKGIGLTAARDIFSTFTAGLLEPLKEKWDNLFKLDGKLMTHLKNAAKDIIESFTGPNAIRNVAIAGGGAAIGGAIGGAKGATVGGLAGTAVTQLLEQNWIGAAITGISAIGVALSGVFGKGRKMADEFIKNFQTPFNDSVKGLFDSLQEAQAMGTLTASQVKNARQSFEKMWTDFQGHAAAAGKVGQQALETMGPFVASWRQWLDGLEKAGAELERVAAIQEIVNKVMNSADGWEAMEAALAQMIESGMSWTPIVAHLGGDITTLAENMTMLGMTVPPYMQAILDQIDANEAAADAAEKTAAASKKAADEYAAAIKAYNDTVLSFVNKVAHPEEGMDALDEAVRRLQSWGVSSGQILHTLGSDILRMGDAMKVMGMNMTPTLQALYNMAKAQARIIEIDKELENVGDQLGKALVQKMDYLVGALEKAKKNLQDWAEEVGDLNKEIKGYEKTLNDAKYWQEEFQDAIQETSDTIKDLAEKRLSLEERIAALTLQNEKDRLQTIIDTSQDSAAVAEAERLLAQMEKDAKAKEMADRVGELERLKAELADVIKKQGEAQTAYEMAAAAAQQAIAEQKNEIREKLSAAEKQRKMLLENIQVEKQRIITLEADIEATQKLMNIMGVARLDELGKINDTIDKLKTRGLELANERDRLIDVAGAASNANTAIGLLVANLREISGQPPTAPKTAATNQPTAPLGTPGTPTAPTAVPTGPGRWVDDPLASGGRRFIPFIADPTVPGGYREYATGSWDVPSTGPAIVHKNEMIIPAHIARSLRAGEDSGGVVVNVNVSVSNEVLGDLGETASAKIIDGVNKAIRSGAGQLLANELVKKYGR